MANKQRRWDTEFPEILPLWDEELNKKTPENYAYSRAEAHWKCDQGHNWITSPRKMARWGGCPICTNTARYTDDNRNFAVIFPEILKEWDYELNKVDPAKLPPHSGKLVYWKCEKGHSWKQTVNGRTKGFSCPYCSGLLPHSKNNLGLYEVAKEFHPSKNEELTPEKLMPKSNKRIWWICQNGHEYKARIGDRVCKGSGCPLCKKSFSRIEIRIYSELKSLFPEALWQEKIAGLEVDVFLPTLKVGIEFDGSYWHKNKVAYDKKKSQKLENMGLHIIRVREEPLTALSLNDIVTVQIRNDIEELNLMRRIVKSLENFSGQDFSDYISRKTFSNQKLYAELIRIKDLPKKSIIDVAPHLKNEWHPTKNGYMAPTNLSYGSQRKAWWKCDQGHAWSAIISSRVKGHGCPFCTGRYPTETNNFAVLYPEQAKSWHPTKNGELQPEEVAPKSNKRVWWQCEKGHEWQTLTSTRANGSDCPICKDQRRVNGKYTKKKVG